MIVEKRVERVALLAVLLSSLSACAHHGHHAHAHHAQGTILVTGVGEAHGAPDIVRTSIGVEARAPSVQEALQTANAQIERVLKALKDQGISDSQLRTHGFSVSYDREYVAPSAPAAAAATSAAPAKPETRSAARGAGKATAEIASAPAEIAAPVAQPTRGSYVVNNQLELTLRDVSKLGSALSAATEAGANNIWGINFDLADKRPLQEQARAQAMENAKSDAQRVAALSGVKLGKVLKVSDGTQGNAVPMGMMREQAMSANAVPVREGELTISHQVSVEYAIAE